MLFYAIKLGKCFIWGSKSECDIIYIYELLKIIELPYNDSWMNQEPFSPKESLRLTLKTNIIFHRTYALSIPLLCFKNTVLVINVFFVIGLSECNIIVDRFIDLYALWSLRYCQKLTHTVIRRISWEKILCHCSWVVLFMQ